MTCSQSHIVTKQRRKKFLLMNFYHELWLGSDLCRFMPNEILGNHIVIYLFRTYTETGELN